jgi:nucleoside-diphosphate kinase|tara:strand:+ start:8927 stop:9505 length:579 start_codon:yes stop_codon:yes gene_type:complete
MKERTLVLIKPDGVIKGIAGKIISRFEESGLKIIGMKMIWADEELAKNHYFLDENWAKEVYEKTKKGYQRDGKEFPYKDHLDIGNTIQKWNMEFLKEGPIIAVVLEGPHAIEIVRKMIGSTEPMSSAPGTIRGDFASVESYAVADLGKRVLRNLTHASDSQETARREINLWFSEDELHSNYKTVHEMLVDKK